jgi:hypothetical protein
MDSLIQIAVFALQDFKLDPQHLFERQRIVGVHRRGLLSGHSNFNTVYNDSRNFGQESAWAQTLARGGMPPHI